MVPSMTHADPPLETVHSACIVGGVHGCFVLLVRLFLHNMHNKWQP